MVLKMSHVYHPGSAIRHRLVKSAAAVLLVVIAAVAGVLLAWNAGLLRSSSSASYLGNAADPSMCVVRCICIC